MFENIGSGEILLILLVILIFFGPKKIPELAQSLGKGLRKFNDAKSGLEDQVKTAMKEPLEALTGAKQGFEAKMREIAEPLHAELKIPPPQAPAAAPSQPAPPETMARGTVTDTPEQTKIPDREA
ncbi:MAG: twin-arginine translocase TatA/TatE family subunit [Bacteroidota bacterium]|nr:twin-arginine translocase TatA/TatE family subunit [Bacteroidota bacterium]MDP4232215.1 twin-arginine translocase TatA/TatE family subunit [Bacteroidota bacterium]MDP4243604.1 twin-arginine translocase TatA/TatE family subunit [Bacteroidota bacterium]MDP4288743.1 twin-arginine translocase TatA/TatE family subunit [Bacteroidota bacterium]